MCVCDYMSMIRCNVSKDLIIIDEGVLPSVDTNNSHIAESPLTRQFTMSDKSHSQLFLTSRPSLVSSHSYYLRAIIGAGAKDYLRPVITIVISSSKQ